MQHLDFFKKILLIPNHFIVSFVTFGQFYTLLEKYIFLIIYIYIYIYIYI